MTHPLLIELNTRCWLHRLCREEARSVTLSSIPERCVREWNQHGFTHVWAMGVWETGQRSRHIGLDDATLRRKFDEIHPEWKASDVPGSPYAVADYQVPDYLGGNEGLATFRAQLNACGIKLILDFVPNHMGLDHAWVQERPHFFVTHPEPFEGGIEVLSQTQKIWMAHGKDPYFEPWRDVVQLDYRKQPTRDAMTNILSRLSDCCDGLRCDMAMLQINEIFHSTWIGVGEPAIPAKGEFWKTAIASIKMTKPHFLFLAESYWGTGDRLQLLGFDFTYHKETLDLLLHDDAALLPKHLFSKSNEQLHHAAHFLENHDEPRIASLLEVSRHKMAAVLTVCLPGMRMVYEGQSLGAKLRVPVQFGLWPEEAVDTELQAFYLQLFHAVKASAVGDVEWRLLEPKCWEDNRTGENIIVIQWWKKADEFDLAVLNCGSKPAQCLVMPHFDSKVISTWHMRDRLGKEQYKRDQTEMESHGLYLSVAGFAHHLFHFQRE